MKTVTIERWTWVLIFGGLMVLSLSWFIDPAERVLAGLVGLGGLAAAVLGVVLIVMRSRMKAGDKSS
jgi:uncharacterized membrane protein